MKGIGFCFPDEAAPLTKKEKETFHVLVPEVERLTGDLRKHFVINSDIPIIEALGEAKDTRTMAEIYHDKWRDSILMDIDTLWGKRDEK